MGCQHQGPPLVSPDRLEDPDAPLDYQVADGQNRLCRRDETPIDMTQFHVTNTLQSELQSEVMAPSLSYCYDRAALSRGKRFESIVSLQSYHPHITFVLYLDAWTSRTQKFKSSLPPCCCI